MFFPFFSISRELELWIRLELRRKRILFTFHFVDISIPLSFLIFFLLLLLHIFREEKDLLRRSVWVKSPTIYQKFCKTKNYKDNKNNFLFKMRSIFYWFDLQPLSWIFWFSDSLLFLRNFHMIKSNIVIFVLI